MQLSLRAAPTLIGPCKASSAQIFTPLKTRQEVEKTDQSLIKVSFITRHIKICFVNYPGQSTQHISLEKPQTQMLASFPNLPILQPVTHQTQLEETVLTTAHSPLPVATSSCVTCRVTPQSPQGTALAMPAGLGACAFSELPCPRQWLRQVSPSPAFGTASRACLL